MSRLTVAECYERNLIGDDGFYGPFVAIDGQTIYVGDCDNLEVFTDVAAARQYARRARLRGGQLSRARRAHSAGYGNNDAAEYAWHRDAGLQLSALSQISLDAA